jgi:hypothetical protein
MGERRHGGGHVQVVYTYPGQASPVSETKTRPAVSIGRMFICGCCPAAGQTRALPCFFPLSSALRSRRRASNAWKVSDQRRELLVVLVVELTRLCRPPLVSPSVLQNPEAIELPAAPSLIATWCARSRRPTWSLFVPRASKPSVWWCWCTNIYMVGRRVYVRWESQLGLSAACSCILKY